MADSDKIDTIYHYTYINNVMIHFFKDTLDYFTYMYPRFQSAIVGTYDKAVQYLLDVEKYGNREQDKPNLPAVVLNPSGDFNIADGNTGAKNLYRFPHLAPGMVKRLYEPIYQDQNVLINVGFTRLKGDIELMVLLNSFYEYTDFRLLLIQQFGGMDRYIYPRWFNSFIILPSEVYLYRYQNDVTGQSYQLDWAGSPIDNNKLVKSTNTREVAYTCRIRPIYKLTSISDNSVRFGGVERLADWRMAFTLEYEIEIPSYIILQTDWLSQKAEIKINYDSCYTEYPDYNTDFAENININYQWDFGLDETSTSEITYPDNYSGVKQETQARVKVRYYHVLTDLEIDSTSDIEITLPELITDINLLQLRSKYGLIQYGDYYIISDDGTTLTLFKDNIGELEAGDILELYVFEYL